MCSECNASESKKSLLRTFACSALIAFHAVPFGFIFSVTMTNKNRYDGNENIRKYSNFTKLNILGKLVLVSAVLGTMATKSWWILVLSACLLSAVLGKCINITKPNAEMEKFADFADFGVSKWCNVVF